MPDGDFCSESEARIYRSALTAAQQEIARLKRELHATQSDFDALVRSRGAESLKASCDALAQDAARWRAVRGYLSARVEPDYGWIGTSHLVLSFDQPLAEDTRRLVDGIPEPITVDAALDVLHATRLAALSPTGDPNDA
jgi:hypothetical protein